MSTTAVPLVTDATIDAAIAPGSGVVAVEFSAAWCAPCRVMAPIVEAVAQEFAPALRVLQVDADANPRTVARWGVRGLPSMLFFRDGELVDRVVGAVPKPVLAARIERALAT
jgi:thioredoxin 1